MEYRGKARELRVAYSNTDIRIQAIMSGSFRFQSESSALKEMNHLKNTYIVSRRSEPDDDYSAVIWIWGYDVTEEEKENNIVGNFAKLQIKRLNNGLFTIYISEKIEVEDAKFHPRRRLPKYPQPNIGHPIIRAARNGKIYETREKVRTELEQLHIEYPKTTIPATLDTLYLLIYSHDVSTNSRGVKKYIIRIVENKSKDSFSLQLEGNNFEWRDRNIRVDEALNTISSYLWSSFTP